MIFENYFRLSIFSKHQYSQTTNFLDRLMSANTLRKAKKLVESGSVEKIDEDLFQIKSSSDPNKSYFATSDTCECVGFKNFYKFHHGKGLKANCSHLEAVRIIKKETN